MSVFRVYCIRSIHRASVHCDFIRAKSFELHKTLERMNFPPCTMFCFRKFSPILSISGADENGWSQPRNFARPLCPFCIRFVSVGQWDRAFRGEFFIGTFVIIYNFLVLRSKSCMSYQSVFLCTSC